MPRTPFLLVLCALAGCATPPPPSPTPEPAPVAPTPPSEPASSGTVRVMAATLNVRKEPSTGGEVVVQVKKGERLVLLATHGEWSNVRLSDGRTGWVSSKLVAGDAAQAASTRRRGCQPDSDYRFTKAPLPSVNDDQKAHGVVTVDANVDTRGNVTSTTVVANTTGDPSLGATAESEIRNAKFTPPVRNCVAKAFIFTYRRSF